MNKISKQFLLTLIAVLSFALLCETFYFRHEIKSVVKNRYHSARAFIKDAKKIDNFVDSDIRPNSVIIFEPNIYHFECMPGYIKYFLDLGYNVDVLISTGYDESLERAEFKNDLRIFEFDRLEDLNFFSSKVSDKLAKYDYSLIHSADVSKKEIINNLGYLKNPNSLFVVHDTVAIEKLGLEGFNSKGQVFTLADYGIANYVNPNYFGEITPHEKNDVTTFFITSTVGRDYLPLVKAVKALTSQGINLKVEVTGHSSNFSKDSVPDDLQKYFEFHGKVPYQKMYSLIENSDYVIVNLDSAIKGDLPFKTTRATGSAQLAYGFAKPMIISSDFASTYKLTGDTAIKYENDDILSAIKTAVELDKNQYRIMRQNMISLCKNIYDTCLENVRKVIGTK